ncbi:MAG TPA: hypothetical protein VHX61_13480 [Rhizomicrobium sp.]|nr:hypothetical protein [Rhizomicrobium sp.]
MNLDQSSQLAEKPAMIPAVIDVGEKVHIIARRHFKEDQRRHFVGTVSMVSAGQIRVEGYTFGFNPTSSSFQRLPELRTRIFGILDSGYVINVIPRHVDVDRLRYHANQGTLVMSDGQGFKLEINDSIAA